MIEKLRRFLVNQKWALFLLQQVLLFAMSVAIIMLVRKFTGKTVHGGRDPFGFWDGSAVLLVMTLMAWISARLYRWAEGPDAPPLGLAPARRMLPDFAIGTAVAYAIGAWPTLLAILLGQQRVTDTMWAHFGPLGIAQNLLIGGIFLVANSLSEEAANRAFPMQLMRRYSVVLQVLVPSVIFAAVHLADESFRPSAFLFRTVAGVVFSLCYALTRNIWLASGVHTGMNLSSVWCRGQWHVGSLVALEGSDVGPEWLVDAIWLVIAVGGLWILRRRLAPAAAAPPTATS
jgi:membrane protease YdiL (CAAX protease family)